MNVRLQNCLNFPPPDPGIKLDESPKKTSKKETTPGGIEFPDPHCGPVHNLLLLKWVQRLQFKMGQIELQSSAASSFVL
jgi:hypothetical protein